jgi:hypothetical protein
LISPDYRAISSAARYAEVLDADTDTLIGAVRAASTPAAASG